ncbi:MAG: 16S rRNA (uracil(1498)-N(3))-methyltransferase [Phycisphaeraceae bacterium]|nr:MAG: 16S rRNA (uracil(1498)-N(3))-methyltransferase [Phycisphaeraceae bacterium]
MSLHRLLTDSIDRARPGERLTIEGEEALHAARARRAREGEPVVLHDGQGRTAGGTIAAIAKRGRADHWALDVMIDRIEIHPSPTPRLEVLAAAPKGDRLEAMVDALSQVGAASWSPLRCERGVVDPGEGKFERSRRVARESLKQCGRAWLMEILPHAEIDALVPSPGVHLIVAHAGAPRYTPTPDGTVRLIVGPEGGLTDDEIRTLKDRGAALASFGPNVMRIETAAVAAAAIILDALGRAASTGHAPHYHPR